jgi:hypothetical protein
MAVRTYKNRIQSLPEFLKLRQHECQLKSTDAIAEFRGGENMSRLLGDNGTRIFLRLSAFIALCVGVQIVWNGVGALIASLSRGQ